MTIGEDLKTTTANAGALLSMLGAGCEALAASPSLQSERDLLSDIVAHTAEPLRVAVAGDVSTGKSSLVNALIGQEVAAVERKETTDAVTWFRPPGAIAPPPLARPHRACAVDYLAGPRSSVHLF